MMKKAILLLMVLSVLTVVGNSVYSQQHISDQPVQKVIKAETLINPSRGGWNVLVIRDILPWGCDVTVPILTGLGATVSTANSATFPSLDFSLFNKIVVESAQEQSFYTILSANLSKFETYVNNGGVLEINACTMGPSVNLPGGALSYQDFSSNGYHALPGHPFLIGVPDPFYGSWASHNAIGNLPPEAEIITRNTSTNSPTTATYSLGTGTVIVTGLTLEIAYYYENNGSVGIFDFGKAMYPNMLGFMPTLKPPVPLTDWALFIGIAMIGVLIFVRFRKLV